MNAHKTMNQSLNSVIVIGAGASGMMAAVAAAREGADVTILERNARPGKKLLLTGNGRCNLTHNDPHLWERYHSDEPEALRACCRSLKERMDVPETLAFFEDLGLMTWETDGYVYPLSNSSQSVLQVLQREMEMLKVRRKYAGKVTGLTYSARERMWKVKTETYTYSGRCVILAAGSRACPETGSDGSGYDLAAQTGHTVLAAVPSLTAVQSSLSGLEKAAGSRCRAAVTAIGRESGERVSDLGQVQWNRDGISGIVVFQVSGFIARRLHDGRETDLYLDFLPDLSEEEAASFLARQLQRGFAVPDLLKGILQEKLAVLVGKQFEKAQKQGDGRMNTTAQACGETAAYLARFLKTFRIPVTGVRGFDQAQVCRGGVALSQIDPLTMESVLAPGLFFAGEILDADGPCGGYNLQWAWSTGYVAGSSSARMIREPGR